MSVSYINKRLTEEEFFDKVYKQGKSKSSEKLVRAAISNLKYFTQDKYKKTRFDVLDDLTKDFEKTKNTELVLRFLQDFIDWLDTDHPTIRYRTHPNDMKGRPLLKKDEEAIRGYVGRIRRYIKLCHGIKIDDDDYQDYLIFPTNDEEDEEAEPLEKEEFKLILDNVRNPRRKTMYMVMKDTRLRIIEALRVKKKYFDLTKDPVTLTIPKVIQKNKRTSKTTTVMISRETTPGLRRILKNIEDEDLVFTDNHNDITARNNEETVWNRLVKKIGFIEKYKSGHIKKNIHSIGAFTITALKEATKDADYAHGYGRHKLYLAQYIRLTEERKIQLFRQSESYLSLYEQAPVVTDQDERITKLEQKLEKYQMLDKLIENIEQPKLEELLKNLSKK
jgi:integrase